MIFDMISVKARWERWCRWNCDLRVINARKKAFSVVPKESPQRPNHMTIYLLRHSGESLQNGQLELQRRNWYFARETHKDTAVSVWACQAGFWKSTGIPWGLQNRTPSSARYTNGCDAVRLFELYKFNPLSPHCGSIAWELVHCYTWGRLRIVTVRGNTAKCYSSRQHSRLT